MTRKSVQVLVAIVVALMLLLVVVDHGHHDVPAGREIFLQGFEDIANDAREVAIRSSGSIDGISIHRADSGWVVSSRDDYAADLNKLGQLISALADARIVEEKTSNPANYGKLGVDDPADGGSGTLIGITGPDVNYSVVLGKTAQRTFRYARVAEQQTSYLIDQNPSIPDDAGGWLAPDIVDIPASRVQRVSVVHADGETIVIDKTEEAQTDYDILDIPDGRELSYATVGNGMAGVLAELKLDDVRRQVETPAETVTRFETWDGLTLSVKAIADDDRTWLAFEATAGDAKPGAAGAAGEAADINARLSGWQYRIADYKKNLLVRRWDDILKAAE